MSEHKASVIWTRNDADFLVETFDRNHEWAFEGGVRVPASSAPTYFGDPARVDPEEAFVASLSSCHMLYFLFFAARQGVIVDSYQDDAVGVLQKGPDGKLWMTDVTLHPRIRFGGEPRPSQADLAALHDKAHHYCFLANSVRTTVTVDPR